MEKVVAHFVISHHLLRIEFTLCARYLPDVSGSSREIYVLYHPLLIFILIIYRIYYVMTAPHKLTSRHTPHVTPRYSEAESKWKKNPRIRSKSTKILLWLSVTLTDTTRRQLWFVVDDFFLFVFFFAFFCFRRFHTSCIPTSLHTMFATSSEKWKHFEWITYDVAVCIEMSMVSCDMSFGVRLETSKCSTTLVTHIGRWYRHCCCCCFCCQYKCLKCTQRDLFMFATAATMTTTTVFARLFVYVCWERTYLADGEYFAYQMEALAVQLAQSMCSVFVWNWQQDDDETHSHIHIKFCFGRVFAQIRIQFFSHIIENSNSWNADQWRGECVAQNKQFVFTSHSCIV